jgi:flotillin
MVAADNATTLATAISSLVIVLVFFAVYLARLVKVPPNMALIITGPPTHQVDSQGRTTARGYRIVSGGRAFVWPFFHKANFISLEVRTVEFRYDVTLSDARARVAGTLQVRIPADEPHIAAAAVSLLSKSDSQMETIAREIFEAPFRAAVTRRTLEEMLAHPSLMRDIPQEPFEVVGLEAISLTLKDVAELKTTG